MRVFLLAAATLVMVACSAAPDGPIVRRSGGSGSAAANDANASRQSDDSRTDGASGSSSGQATPSPAQAPAPSTTSAPAPAPTTTTPAPAPPAGSCANPKCIGFQGTGGCKATDTKGATVVLGCDQGACACFTNNQQTSAFAGSASSADDLKALFIADCDCL